MFRKNYNLSTLEGILPAGWKMLRRGVRNPLHPFHRPSLATLEGAAPEVRTVILRGFSASLRHLICHCDARTAKVHQIETNPHVSWLFYDHRSRIQLRFSGTASVHTEDSIADTQWQSVSLTGRLNYCAETPPGSGVEKPTSGLPEFLRHKPTAVFKEAQARRNFAAIVCVFDRMDWLHLKLSGNIRAEYLWQNGRMEARWIIP
ncbi:MAG: pyridoxamine 5'-phosphate oxidase family protein [Desulfobacterales bacterium]